MKLEDLRPAAGTKKVTKRKGRGNASGTGTTGGRGQKGQKARSGGFHKVGFEGGQMPLQRRLPKFGFTNFFRKTYAIVNLNQLDKLSNESDITPQLLVEKGIVSNRDIQRIKILGDGTVTKAYNIKAHKFSKSAVKKIEEGGGKTEVLN